MPPSLRSLVESDKAIRSPADWSLRAKGKLDLKLALSIDGLTIEGLWLKCCAIEHLPEQEVVFMLLYDGVGVPGVHGNACLSRVEWNPVRGHDNKGRGPRELRHVQQSGTHVHYFKDNWNDKDECLMRGNLPVARPVIESIQGFSACLDFVGKLFRINNIIEIKAPEWSAKLIP